MLKFVARRTVQALMSVIAATMLPYLRNLFTGDLGIDFERRRPVFARLAKAAMLCAYLDPRVRVD